VFGDRLEEVVVHIGGIFYVKRLSKHDTVQLTLRRLMSYIYGAPILAVSRPQTTTQHSR